MKNVLTAILLSALILAVGCASSDEPEVFEEDFESETSGTNLDGLEMLFNFYTSIITGDALVGNVMGYAQDTLLAEKASQRLADVEKELNCKITMNMNASNDIFTLASASGTFCCDAYYCSSDPMLSWEKAGFLVGITTLSDIINYKDSEKWGQPNLLEAVCYNGELYGVLPAAWPELSFTSFGYPMVTNMDLVSANTGLDLREVSEAGEWDWAMFEDVLEQCTVVEGGEVKSYGLATHYPYFSQMIIASNGVTFAQIDANGKPYCGFYTNEGRRALAEVQKIYQGELKNTVWTDEDADAGKSLEAFISGIGAFTFTPAHGILGGVSGTVSMSMDNYGIIAVPYGPDSSPEQVTSLYHSDYYTITLPVTSDKTEETAMILNEIFEPFEGFETYDEIRDYMSKNYFFDPRDAELYFQMQQNAKLNYDYQTGFVSRKIPEEICKSGKTVEELLNAHEANIDKIFEEAVIPIKTANNAIFGK